MAVYITLNLDILVIENVRKNPPLILVVMLFKIFWMISWHESDHGHDDWSYVHWEMAQLSCWILYMLKVEIC